MIIIFTTTATVEDTTILGHLVLFGLNKVIQLGMKWHPETCEMAWKLVILLFSWVWCWPLWIPLPSFNDNAPSPSKAWSPPLQVSLAGSNKAILSSQSHVAPLHRCYLGAAWIAQYKDNKINTFYTYMLNHTYKNSYIISPTTDTSSYMDENDKIDINNHHTKLTYWETTSWLLTKIPMMLQYMLP